MRGPLNLQAPDITSILASQPTPLRAVIEQLRSDLHAEQNRQQDWAEYQHRFGRPHRDAPHPSVAAARLRAIRDPLHHLLLLYTVLSPEAANQPHPPRSTS